MLIIVVIVGKFRSLPTATNIATIRYGKEEEEEALEDHNAKLRLKKT